MIRRNILTRSLLAATVALACLDAPAQDPNAVVPIPDKKRDRQQVLELERKGNELLVREKRADSPEKERIRQERKQIFHNAAWKLQQYRTTWIPDSSTVEYLRATFRLASYYERAGSDDLAQVWYRRCKGHERINDPAALWQNEPLAAELQKRLREAGSVVIDEQHVTTVRTIEHSKDGIAFDISELTPDNSHRPLLEDEVVAVALRRTPSAHRQQAVPIGKALLDKHNLQYHVSEANDLVVFGVGAGAEQVNLLRNQLVRMRRQLTTQYFDGAAVSPVLFVYANLDAGNESLGCALSRAVHFREQAYLEGYYESLDHSLVLRKSLYFPYLDQPWFLGTALHELVHAHIHVEFPSAPPWLNEGLASLHEATDWGGPIDNYRLYYVRDANEKGKLPKLKHLLDPAAEGWHGKKARLMHAMARYFCFYLWKRSAPENNDLRQVYRLLRDDYLNAQGDLSSAEALKNVTGMPVEEIEKKFRAFIQSRDMANVDRTWGQLKYRIGAYIDTL
jgi:hypothetical protein